MQACSAPKESTRSGAFVELQDGYKSVIQALGNAFGDYRDEPYVQLKGDDRTGDVSDGEWLHINGREWKHIREVLIYAFIYEGVPSWDKTDGVVTIHVPDQPPIETRLTEGENRRTLCAIARLVNENGAIKVERINQYFKGRTKWTGHLAGDFAGAPVLNNTATKETGMSFFDKVKGAINSGRDELTRRVGRFKTKIHAGHRCCMCPYCRIE